MGKLSCICGHTILDQADLLPYKGYIFPDVELDNLSRKMADTIDSLSDATKQSKRHDWIRERFTVPPYPLELSDASMVHDIISGFLSNIKKDIFECENCGRIAIQVGETNQFRFYKPEVEGSKGVLSGQKQRPT